MRAEAATFEYAPSYRYQTPENGSGSTPRGKETNIATNFLNEKRDQIERFAKELSVGGDAKK